jgi:FkbM family methyltransferase
MFTLPERVYKHLHFQGIIQINLPEARSIKMHHYGYLVENDLFWRGTDGWERNSLRLWMLLCQSSSTMIDVGANTGVYALIGKTLAPQARVIAIEPVDRVYRKLLSNIELNQLGIEAMQVALTDQDGVVALYDQPGAEHEYDSTLNKEFSSEYPDAIAVEVQGRSLDSLVKELGLTRVELMKIDVEMHEPELLAGARMVLARDRPAMLIEVLNEHIGDRIMKTIKDLDYVHYCIDEGTWPPEQVDHLGRSDHHNFLICEPKTARAIGLTVRGQ